MDFFVCLFFTRRIWLSTHLLSIDSTLFFVCSPIWYKSVLSCFKSEAFVDWIHNGTRCWWNNEQRFCFIRRDILSLYTLNYTVKHLQQFTRSILIFFFFLFFCQLEESFQLIIRLKIHLPEIVLPINAFWFSPFSPKVTLSRVHPKFSHSLLITFMLTCLLECFKCVRVCVCK